MADGGAGHKNVLFLFLFFFIMAEGEIESDKSGKARERGVCVRK